MRTISHIYIGLPTKKEKYCRERDRERERERERENRSLSDERRTGATESHSRHWLMLRLPESSPLTAGLTRSGLSFQFNYPFGFLLTECILKVFRPFD
jgi:hypothetical protein